jgi:uncharacterized membrane protein YphA (DoxX/SURF4 family)
MTDSFASLAAIIVAAVFTVAAISKLMAPERTTREFTNLGLPVAGLLARLVPAAELVAVGLLLFVPRLGGLVSVLLISGFTVVLLNVLQSGRTVSCGCLGALSEAPISLWTIARNGGLLLMATAASAVDSLSVPGVAAVLVAGSALLLIAIGVQLLKLRAEIGTLWRIDLAGELDREPELVLDLEIDLDQQVERLVPSNVYPANREG